MLAAGTADTLWFPAADRLDLLGSRLSRFAGSWPRRWLGRAAVLAALTVFALLVAPRWAAILHRQAAVHGATGSLAATAWVERYVPRHAVVVVDDYIWPDLKIAGDNPLWLWKVDGDPQVSRQELPQGWRSIQYIVMTSEATTMLSQLPTLQAAMAHSVVVASFSQGVTVRTVIRAPATPPPVTPPAAAPPGTTRPPAYRSSAAAPHAGILACFLPGPWPRS